MDKTAAYRIGSIDILRGLVMIIMALDHTRDFFHSRAMLNDPLDIATTTVPLFFTRWITHYCAPIFVFLSGISAFLSSKNKTKKEASIFLMKRGLWLVFIEVVVITLGLTFNPLYNFIILQVIWAIGCSMIILGLLTRFPLAVVLITGLILFFGHNIFDEISIPQTGLTGVILQVLFTASGTVVPLDKSHFLGVFYAILPWTSVMLTGYAIGYWYRKEFDAVRRKKLLLICGISLIGLFVILRYFNIYGDPAPWDKVHFLSFLNTNKYPPSLLYLCMTIGPAMIALSFWENVNNGLSRIFSVYGRVPFFYYVLHFYILHTLLVIAFFVTGHHANEIVDSRIPFLFRPIQFGYGLAIVYIIWLSVVALLYQPCRWFNKYKMRHTQWWLKYL